MRIVFLNRFFYPDISPTSQILSDLAFHFAEDHEVHVITSRLQYDEPAERLPARERVRGVVVHRVWSSRFGRSSLAGRTADYLTFYASASARLRTVARRGDIVIAMTDPPLISVPAAAIAARKGARLVNWIQDMFPEVAGELDFKWVPARVRRPLTSMRDRSLKAAERNIALGEGMARRLADRIHTDRVRVIHNWSSGEMIRPVPPERNPLRREWELDGKFVVGYSGNMGRAHDFGSLLAAAERLSERRAIVFLLIGGGKQRHALEATVRSRGLGNVLFRPYQPREMLGHSLTAPDCHIVSLKPSLEGLIVPSKLYSSLAAGRPVIFLGAPDGEVARLMSANRAFGIRVAPDDTAGLANAIEYLHDNRDRAAALGKCGRDLFERQFDQPIAMAHWRDVIAGLMPA